MRRAIVAAGTVALVGLAGCADLGYYWQSANGHIDVMRAARPVPQWLDDPTTSAPLRAKLELTQRIRRFAVTELGLPDNRSYTGYADLHRNAAVWNVVAAPPYSLTLQTWCFPVAGCVGYRGYYDEALAQAEAQSQRAKGLEVSVYPVPAYSTLGWLNWAGGDPLLSTFIGYPEGELARLIFHELSHQLVYVADDTSFNESFATAVERIGGARWLATQASEAARTEYAQFDARRQQFRALTLATRRRLQAVYSSPQAMAKDWAAVEVQKGEVMAAFRAEFAVLRSGWPPQRQAAYDGWVARANNAAFGAQAAYDDLVPGFEALFEREGREWPRFYAEVRRLAALPKTERHAALQAGSALTAQRSTE
ncbi:aminopeptidase [Variovorax sp. LT1R16]|uniref:aminopeptidase n=1 Tax=Variovorax sp. LT1R16 TaxID=3443728 RepID=UPI003F487EC8